MAETRHSHLSCCGEFNAKKEEISFFPSQNTWNSSPLIFNFSSLMSVGLLLTPQERYYCHAKILLLKQLLYSKAVPYTKWFPLLTLPSQSSFVHNSQLALWWEFLLWKRVCVEITNRNLTRNCVPHSNFGEARWMTNFSKFFNPLHVTSLSSTKLSKTFSTRQPSLSFKVWNLLSTTEFQPAVYPAEWPHLIANTINLRN